MSLEAGDDAARTAATDAPTAHGASEQLPEPQRTKHQRSKPSPNDHAEQPPFFGFPRYGRPTRGGLEDYKETYPDDPYGAEAGANARVWRVYLEESGQLDEDMLRQFRDTLDVHLVFAALFSSVVTGFVVQTSQALQSDYGRISAALLMELVALQRAGSPDGVPSANVDLESRSASAYDVAINSCFMVSLALSLATTLLAVLVKQWLVYYAAVPPGSARDRALIHQLRYKALKKWKVSEIVGIVPSALNASLVVFLAGLVLFAYGLHWFIFADILIITLATLILYVYSNILPVLHWECPYRTPLAFLLRKWARHWKKYHPMSFNIPLESYREIETTLVSFTLDGRSHALKVMHLMHDALRWLHRHAGNPTAKDVLLESIAGLSRAPCVRDDWQWMLDMLDTLKERLQHHVNPGDKQSLLDLERRMRALTTMYSSIMQPPFTNGIHETYNHFQVVHAIVESDIQQWIAIIDDDILKQRIVITYNIFAESPRLYHECIFSLGQEVELPPSIWKSLLIRSLNNKPLYIVEKGADFAWDYPPCQHCFGEQRWSRGQLADILIRFAQGLADRVVIDSGSPRYRPGEGPATLHKVCSWYADIRQDLVGLLCELLGQKCQHESALLASLLNFLLSEGFSVPAPLRLLASHNLRHAASQMEDVVSDAEPYNFARLDAVSTLLSVLTDPRMCINVAAEDLASVGAGVLSIWDLDGVRKDRAIDDIQRDILLHGVGPVCTVPYGWGPNILDYALRAVQMLSFKKPVIVSRWQPSLHCLFSSLDNVLHLMERYSLCSPHTTPIDYEYESLYHTTFDLFEQYKSLVLDMEAYSRNLQLDGHPPTGSKLLSDKTIHCMIMLCSPSTNCLERVEACTDRYMNSLQQLYTQMKDLSFWRHGLMTSILSIHRVNAARRGPELDSLQLSRYRALRRFAEIVGASDWTDNEGEYIPYVYCTVEYLQSLGVEGLQEQDELVYGPYAVPFSSIDGALPPVIPMASVDSEVEAEAEA
ncbi:hypothetical protein EV715DRAFT_296623 [Schizophyllum commune]